MKKKLFTQAFSILVVLFLSLTSYAQEQTPVEISDWRSKLSEDHNLSFELGYTLIFQGASRYVDRSPALLSGSYDFGLTWQVIPEGEFNFVLEGGQIISNNRHEDLSGNIGSSLGINDDLDNQDAVLSEVNYTHAFDDDQLIFTIGKIDQSAFFDANEIANDETAQFLATPLVNNMAIAFPDNGLGFNVLFNACENFYITGGMGDSNADARESGFTTLEGDYFYGGEVGFINTSKLPGTYRLTFWHTQTPDENGSGIAVSIDQHITDNLVLFGRWGDADKDVSDFETFASAGIGITCPLGRENDLAAIGIAWADPSDNTLGKETIVEAFYRYQLNDLMHLTPGIQAVIDPADAPESDTVYVFSLRLQTTW